jgi:hypothetical protein
MTRPATRSMGDHNDMKAIQRMTAGAVMALALGAFVAGPALACGPEENMMHMGTVASIDAQAHTLTLVDASTGKLLTFKVTDAQLAQVAPKAHVAIHYAKDEGGLVAKEIKV